MKKFIYLCGIIMIGLILPRCSSNDAAGQKSQSSSAIPVETMILKPRPFSEYLQLTGTVEARNHVKIIVEEGGTLRRVKRDKGSLVRQGDTLAFLENKILKASYNEAQAAWNQANLDYNSKKVLFEKRAISENEYLASKYGLERAQAAYELNKARYSKLFILAPLNGYVNNRLYDIGAYATPMTPIFDFIDNAYMKIKAGVAERFLGDIQIGTPAEVTFDAFPDMKLEYQVSFLSRSIDPQSRTFQIEIEVPNPDLRLAPQMIANIKLLRREYSDQIVIPLDAVIESEEGSYVFVLTPENKVRKINLDLRAIYEDSVLVNGLESDQNLIIVGQQELTEGDSVIVTSL
jgi:membrane fusion protein (multidrug efflux system)